MKLDPGVLKRIRAQLIKELEEAIRLYTRDGTQFWGNEGNARELIDELRSRVPVEITAPPWGDFLDGVVYELVSDRNERSAYRQAIENGE